MIGDKTNKASLGGALPNLANPPSGLLFSPALSLRDGHLPD